MFDRPYSFPFAYADTNTLYEKNDRIVRKDRHAKAEEAEVPKEAEEGANEKG